GAGRAGGVLLAVAAMAVLVAAVALASRPEGGSGPSPLGEEPIRVALDAAGYLLVAAVAAGLAVIVWAFWPREGEALPALPPRRRHTVLTMALTMAVAVVLAVWLRALRVGPVGGAAPGGGSAGSGGVPGVSAP